MISEEIASAAGGLHEREGWDSVVRWMERLGTSGLNARGEQVRRILHEQGVTCFLAGAEGGKDEPWRLDLLPLVIGAEEWRTIEAGLLQRVQLLNGILADLYGTQRLVRNGFVPAALVFANPAFLRPCQALPVKGDTYLTAYAADLGRGTDGRWWVLGDRTQAPTGFGFAVHNRSVLARVVPELVRTLQPRGVTDFLRVRGEALRELAPRPMESPAIAMLTPGPRNESYFEQAYLSRLLGLTLVEAEDLTVRDRQVWAKTLSGLLRIDVVVRRVNDSYCDPLELRGDSLLGVPGLVEAARAGAVSIANALGAGLMEGPGFMPFSPAVCRHLLGEDQRLPCVPTWWCGQARELGYVREHKEQLMVRPAFAGLASSGRESLEGLEERPHDWVGQEQIALTRAPVLNADGTEMKPFALRVYVLHDGKDFRVMPGGLARVMEPDERAAGNVRLSGVTKDVWVLPEGAESSPGPQVIHAPRPQVERAGADVPSRTADNLYWLGRYTERLEELARVMRCGVGRLGPEERVGGAGWTRPLEELFQALGVLAASGAKCSPQGVEREIMAGIYEPGRPGGVQDLLERIHLAAFSVRDRLSSDTWQLLNGLGNQMVRDRVELPLVQAGRVLKGLVLDLAAFSGMEMENMTRGHGWAFLDLGRRVERGVFMSRLMRAVVMAGEKAEEVVEPALEIADSVMTHRRRYFSEPRVATVMEVLVRDATNPRSLAFQVACVGEHARKLPMGPSPEGLGALRNMVAELESELGEATRRGVPFDAALLGSLGGRLARFSERLTEVYFSHVMPKVS